MDHRNLVEQVAMPCCVLSVERAGGEKAGRRFGDIRIVAANQAYLQALGEGFHEGMLYQEILPKDNKFEGYCFRAALCGERMHAYVETPFGGGWIDQTLIPLTSDREDVGYCQFVFETTQQREASRMASVSIDAAEEAIEACLTLVEGEDFRESLQAVLEKLRISCGAMACRVILADHEGCRAVRFCESVGPEAVEMKHLEKDAISYELLLSWEETLGGRGAIIVRDEVDMEEIARLNPAWGASMREHGVHTLVLIPLRRSRTVTGYLYVANFDVSRVVHAKELLELMSVFLGAELFNYSLVNRLERLSSLDALTGLRNRRALLQEIRDLKESRAHQSFGVVNIDLNGLKVVNDRDGHEAGDRLLVQAGEILQKVFYQDGLFRTGGDEFVVVTRDISEATFARKLERLKGDVEKNSLVSFAIGSCWSDGTVDVETAFRKADERMYEDKKAFYERNPELRRG